MESKYVIDERSGIKQYVIRGSWNDRIIRKMKRNGAEGLWVNQYSGFRGWDLSFLMQVPNLRRLHLFGDFDNVEVLEQCSNLVSLSIGAGTGADRIDYTKLSKLRYLSITHDPGTDTLFELPHLETLYLAEYRYKDLAPFENLKKLKKLEIGPAYRLTDISHVSKLAETLEMFGLYYATKLTDFNPLALLTNLSELAIETCSKISNINFLHNLTQLEILKVANCKDIDSLAPMEVLQNLQHFYAWQSTKVLDGDLSVLGRLPKLKTVAMARRRHYHGFDLKIG